MTDILYLSTEELRAAFASGDLRPADALQAVLAHVREVDPAINAVPFRADEEQLRTEAEASAQRWASGTQLGALDGIPVTIKDSLPAAGMPWRHGSAPNASLPASTADSIPVQRLREAGTLIIGKTAMPDFGMLGTGVSSMYGVVRNPWDLATTPGGSSAGAGAALAAGIGWAAIGTDIAGSVRMPASYCGLVALKPTQGRIPYLPSSNVRSAGPMARTVSEALDMYDVISQPDPRETHGLPPEADPTAAFAPQGARIGVVLDMGYGFAPSVAVSEAVTRAARLAEAHGATVDFLPPIFEDDPYDPLDQLFQARALAEVEGFSPEDQARVLPEVARWARRAAGMSGTDYERALGQVLRSQLHVAAALRPYDLVLSPTRPVASLPAESVGLDPDRPLADTSFTCWYNQTGQPAASLCFGFETGHPIGLQLIGPRFSDRMVMSAAGWFEAHRELPMDWPFRPRELAAAGAEADGWAAPR